MGSTFYNKSQFYICVCASVGWCLWWGKKERKLKLIVCLRLKRNWYCKKAVVPTTLYSSAIVFLFQLAQHRGMVQASKIGLSFFFGFVEIKQITCHIMAQKRSLASTRLVSSLADQACSFLISVQCFAALSNNTECANHWRFNSSIQLKHILRSR